MTPLVQERPVEPPEEAAANWAGGETEDIKDVGALLVTELKT